jgi:hypothetical protein
MSANVNGVNEEICQHFPRCQCPDNRRTDECWALTPPPLERCRHHEGQCVYLGQCGAECLY